MNYNDRYYQRFFYLPYDEKKRADLITNQLRKVVEALSMCSAHFHLDWHYFDPYICNLERSYQAQSNEDEF